MTEREIQTIDCLLKSGLDQQKFLLRKAKIEWHRMYEKEAHLDKHQHSREFWQACGRFCSARKLVPAYETLIRLWKSAGNMVNEDTMKMEVTNTNRNIRHLRIRNGMSQNELAELAGYTDRSSIAKIESGLVDLPLSKIRTFAKIFNVTAGDLIEEDMREAEGTSLGERMRIIRKAAGLKQNEVAEKIGVAPSTYSLYESGDREPNHATIGAIAAALDVSPAYLVGWEK